MPSQYVLDRSARKKILLPETQFLTSWRGVGRIEHAYQACGPRFSRQRAQMIAGVKGIQANRIDCLCIPQPKCIDAFAAPSHHRRIDSLRAHRLSRLPTHGAGLAANNLSAESDQVGGFAPVKFPRVAV